MKTIDYLFISHTNRVPLNGGEKIYKDYLYSFSYSFESKIASANIICGNYLLSLFELSKQFNIKNICFINSITSSAYKKGVYLEYNTREYKIDSKDMDIFIPKHIKTHIGYESKLVDSLNTFSKLNDIGFFPIIFNKLDDYDISEILENLTFSNPFKTIESD